MTRQLAELFDRHAVASFEKQLFLDEWTQSQPHHFDRGTGRLSFAEDRHPQVHLLGTEQKASHTWRWAWADQQAPAHLLRSVTFLKAMGELQKIPELTEAQCSLDEVNGSMLAAIACGVCRAQGYVRHTQEDGTLFLLIVDEQFPRPGKPSLGQMSEVFTQALKQLTVINQKLAWSGYLRAHGLYGKESGRTIQVERAGEAALIATFDEHDQLLQLEGGQSVGAPPGEPFSEPRGKDFVGARSQPVVAFGPEMPGWGSWDWVGKDIQCELATYYRTQTFRGPEVPPCDVLVLVKHALSQEVLDRAGGAALIFCPVDAYGSAEDFRADRALLGRCARIVIHCERLRPYFEPYAPVLYMDHHVKFAPEALEPPGDGPILWVGVRTNLPPLVEWVNAHPLPAALCLLTNPEIPGQVPSPSEVGFRAHVKVQIEEWSPELHLRMLRQCRAALDIKGSDFRSRHKPPAKAIDYIAAGLPLAMPADTSPVEHLAGMGFEVASPLDPEHWLSSQYRDETRRFGTALRELLSLERIGRRYKRLIDHVLAERTSKR